MILVNKPQFDPTSMSFGDAVMLMTNSCKKTFKSSETQWDKFNSGDNALVLSIHPLSLTVLLKDGKQAKIHVDDVANGSVEIIKLVAQKKEEK